MTDFPTFPRLWKRGRVTEACPPSRAVLAFVVLAQFLFFGAAVFAQGRKNLDKEMQALRERLDAVEKELEETRAERTPQGETADSPDDGAVDFTTAWQRDPLETSGPLRGVYDKPFLASFWRRAHVGGYAELELHAFEDGILGIPEGFRMHRTNLFFFTELSDRVRFGSEIEFETGFNGADVSDEIEVKVEMAFVDWALFEEFKLRGGAILAPLGRINVNHDGPVRELTDRPLVSTFIIPTTLTEAGVGAHGDFAINDSFGLSYEVYAVNGFNILKEDGTVGFAITDREQALREGRSSIGGDLNSGIASTGRLGVELLQAVELGVSWHNGTYDEKSDNFLTILAGDFSYSQQISVVELGLEGEVAEANFERDAFAKTAGIPDDFWGYYVQGSVGILPEALQNIVPHIFDDAGSRLAFVFRYEWVDLDGDEGEVLEPGISLRPIADTVLKFSYRLTQKSIGLRNIPGRSDFDDTGFVFSLSSYF
jgi:hypothetical protein